MFSAELYSYTEEPEFALNRDYFEEDFRSHGTVSLRLNVSDLNSIEMYWIYFGDGRSELTPSNKNQVSSSSKMIQKSEELISIFPYKTQYKHTLADTLLLKTNGRKEIV